MILYHATSQRHARLYRESGCIKSPVRGFDTLLGAMAWAVKTGRKVIYEVRVPSAHKLPDHHNEFGTAFWHEGDVPVRDIRCVFSAGGGLLAGGSHRDDAAQLGAVGRNLAGRKELVETPLPLALVPRLEQRDRAELVCDLVVGSALQPNPVVGAERDDGTAGKVGELVGEGALLLAHDAAREAFAEVADGVHEGLLAGGGAAVGVSRLEAGHGDLAEPRQLDERRAADRLTVPGGEERPAGYVGLLRDDLEAEGWQQVIDGLRQGIRLALGHGGTCSGLAQKNPAEGVDFPMTLAQTCPTQEHPTAARLSQGQATAGSEPEPESEPMTNATKTVPAPQANPDETIVWCESHRCPYGEDDCTRGRQCDPYERPVAEVTDDRDDDIRANRAGGE